MNRRAHGTGSVHQRHATRYGCPPVVDGARPEHSCRAPWAATIETGWTARGTRRRKTVTGKTKAEAQRKIREALREAEQRQAPTVGGKPTVKAWADVWLDNTARALRPTTWAANRSQVMTWVVPTIGHRKLDALRPADVRTIERAMETAGRASSTISRCMAVLDKMLKDALIEGHPVPQSVLLMETVGAGENDRDAIPLPDALALLEAATARPDASRWVAALLQGMRPAECRGLTWDAVDFDDDALDISWQLKPLPYIVPRDRSSGFRVPRNYTTRQVSGALHLVRPKTAKGRRVIPLVPWMREALLAWRDVCPPTRAGLVWVEADGSPLDDKADRAAWVALQDAAQVAHVEGEVGRRYSLYEARHTTATLLREAGVDDETIIAIMGHASILSTRAYLHTNRTKVRAALDQVASRLELEA